MNKTFKESKYFPHIDGLRAFAVIAVIIYHYNENLLTSGLLGVDIFFVISGFVITKYLAGIEISNWPLFLKNFYARRIKRLFPALFFCVVSSALALTFLTSSPSPEIFFTGAFSLLGAANIFLYFNAADYFATDSTLNAFTHTWSLGIEEQFYLFYPIIFGLLGLNAITSSNKIKLTLFSTLIFISFLLFIYINFTQPIAGFYLLPFRAWELGLGGLTYLITFPRKVTENKILPIIIFSLLVYTLTLPLKWNIIATILAVLFTCILLKSSMGITQRLLESKVFRSIGLLSYSLYLWHWPVLVIGKLTIGVHNYISIVLLLIITLLLSTFSYLFIEKPIRYSKKFKSDNAILITALIIITVSFPALALLSSKVKQGNNFLASKFGIPNVYSWPSEVPCHGWASVKNLKSPYSHCLGANRTDKKPYISYLIGDSHAAQLHFMHESANKNSRYTTRFINTEKDFPQTFFSKQTESETLDYIVKHSKANDIVAIAFHRGHLNEQRDKHIPLNKTVELNEKSIYFSDNISPYLKQLDDAGVHVILINDTPLMASISTSQSCLMQLKISGANNCLVNFNQDMHTRKIQDRIYKDLSKKFPKICIWDPLITLYQGQDTFDIIDENGNYTMFDWNHISKEASLSLVEPYKKRLNSCKIKI